MGGDRVHDARKSETRRQEAQDAKDANLTLPGSGRKIDTWDET